MGMAKGHHSKKSARMRLQKFPPPDVEAEDHTAIQLMLVYVEAECRRIGAEAAAHHAALALALLSEHPALRPATPPN